MLKHWLIAGAMSLALGGAAHAQTYRDSNGTTAPGIVPLIGCSTGGKCAGPASPTNPIPVAPQPLFRGSTGRDYSANQPTPPNVGGNFGATGAYANYVLIATDPANPYRFSLDVENTSGAQIVVVLDDGTAASGSAPNNASVFTLAGGGTVGSQGASWTSQDEKGRIQVHAPSSTAQVSVREN
jgi:hypothetical protein